MYVHCNTEQIYNRYVGEYNRTHMKKEDTYWQPHSAKNTANWFVSKGNQLVHLHFTDLVFGEQQYCIKSILPLLGQLFSISIAQQQLLLFPLIWWVCLGENHDIHS